MGFRMIAPKRIRKIKTKNGKEVLHRLEEYLESVAVTGEPVEILCGFWKDQQDAITYQELRQAVLDGTLTTETLELWRQDYSILITERLSNVWTKAIETGPKGQPILDGIAFEFNMQTPGIFNWIKERGANFVTVCTRDQQDAIAALLTKKMREGHTVDELARLIRPCIGLTEGQAKANVRYYDSIVANLRKEHPRMKTERIRKKARDAALKYAERQHRERAFTIAQTESAFAYNRGADEGIRQAQSEGYLGIVEKRWNTSGDDGVCEICASLEGTQIDMDAEFDFKGRVLFTGQKQLPPAHPKCACAIEYIEVSPPIIAPQMEVSITQKDSLREYNDEEINSIAKQTETIVANHIDIPSKWSGNIIVNDKSDMFGKLWNCDILTAHETAPHIILHEQIHARSISYYDLKTYIQYQNIEEASVQFIAQEISMREGIEIIASQYDDMVEALRQIGNRIGVFDDGYTFAKALIEMPVTERMGWLETSLYDIMRIDATIDDYEKMTSLLNMLY